jgi:ArsR family transcriptional regulator, arsenate/arsenite/antimonite-responsive transcriptional repressor
MSTSKKICPNCRLVGEKTRAKIIAQLKKKPKNASKIAECFSLSQPTISHHLKVLEKTGIILSKKIGRETYYSLNRKYPCSKCGI